MRRTLSLLIAFTSLVLLKAQEVQWLSADAVDLPINPEMPRHLIAASDDEHLYVARATTLTYVYSAAYGSAVVEQRDAQGAVNWSFTLGDSLVLHCMAAAPDGRVVLGGRFFRRLHLNADQILPALYTTTTPETFLIALDINGDLLWQRNLAPAVPQDQEVQAVTFDHQGRVWYATCNFFHADIKRVDELGNDVETRPMENAKTIGSISFDPWGGLYVSGAASAPGLTVNGTFHPVTESYNFFVTRMAANGASQWLESARDVTFQRPLVKADAFGHAYLVGEPFDSLSFGGLHFHGPEWNSTFFLLRLDSTGSFEWGYQPPVGAPFTGQFDLAETASLGVNAAGDAVLLGISSGIVEWGNSVVTDIGSIQDRAVTVLALDSTGTPQWELHGGSADLDSPKGLDVLPGGTCHIAVQVRDTFRLGPFTAEIAEPNLVLARISPMIDTGIGVERSTSELRAYPSPFSNSFSLSGTALSGPLRLTIRDASGRIVAMSDRLDGLGSSLASGAYLVELVQGTERRYVRVVKE